MSDRLTLEQQQIADDNIRLVYSYVAKNKRKYPNLDWDDMLGISMEAYCQAIGDYDPNKGSLSSYTFRRMWSAVHRYVTREQEYSIHLEDIGEPGAWEAVLNRVAWDKTPRLDYEAAGRLLESWQDKYHLTPRDVDMLKIAYLYANQLNRRNLMGTALGLTPRSADQMLKVARKKLRPYKEEIYGEIS